MIVWFMIFVALLAFFFLIVSIWNEMPLFGFFSAITFVLEGLILITTAVEGINTRFSIGLGVILALVGVFVAIIAFKEV